MKCTEEELLAIAKDSDYHDLGVLPSMGIPYGDKDFKLYIKTFRLRELKLLSRAAELNEMSHLFRAVDNVISVPVETLTIGDFFYVLLWLRLYSMPKSPYVIEWKCEQPYFTHKETKKPLLYSDDPWPTRDELKSDYNVESCDTENTSVIHQSDVSVISLQEDLALPPGFDFPRVACMIGRAEALKDPEIAMLVPGIQWLIGKTWEEKMAYAEMNPDSIGEALDINRKVTHGIGEKVSFNCRKCRVGHSTTLELNALSFFR
jgi:hypothetical protein